MGAVSGRSVSRGSVSGRAGRALLGAAMAAAIVVSFGTAPARAADQPIFGPATATSAFLTAITLRETVTLPSGVSGIDALVRTEGDERTLATPIEVPGPGQSNLVYRLPTPSGALLPNTALALRFRLTLADGTQALGPEARVRYDDSRFAWRTLAGPVVRVHWVEGGDAFGQRALSIAETAVAHASELFGVSETQPIDFFIYADRTAFYDVIGPALQENIGGRADPGIRTLFANIGSTAIDDAWVSNVVPHELTHIVFGTATQNPYHEPAHWLNEGLAVYLSVGFDAGARASVRGAVADGTLMPLTALEDSFPGSAERFSLAYDEAVSAIDFMIRSYGRDALVRLVRSYADGLTDDEAFRAGIGLDVAGFEAAWLADLGAPAPSPYGPRPAPAGPLPSGWAGAASTAGLAEASPGPDAGAPGAAADPLRLVVAVVGLGLAGFGLGVAATAWLRRRGGRGGGLTGNGGPDLGGGAA
jgi:hypothetical protein